MDNVYILTSSGELYHHGVKGMKWGVRRYQNEDGTLTTEGRKRLEHYKTQERDEAIKRGAKYEHKYSTSVGNLKKTIQEQKSSGGRVDEKTKRDYELARANLKRVKRIVNTELKRIENMTFAEMQSEKMKSAIEIGVYVTGVVAPLPLSDVLAIAIVGDPYDNKTKRRTGESYRKVIR